MAEASAIVFAQQRILHDLVEIANNQIDGVDLFLPKNGKLFNLHFDMYLFAGGDADVPGIDVSRLKLHASLRISQVSK